MAKYELTSKEQICQRYGIKNLNQMKDAYIVDLFENGPKMSPELRSLITKEVPGFAKMVADTIEGAQKTVQVSINKRSEVTKESLKTAQEAIKTIGRIAECDHLSEAERDKLTDKVMEIQQEAKEEAEKTNEDTKSESNYLTYLAYAAALGFGFFVGFKVDPKLVTKLIGKLHK